MKLDDCELDAIDIVSAAPFERNRPEDEWVEARDTGAIPAELYDLYTRANFLSFAAAPRYLSDPENILFSYFGLVLRSIQQSLCEADEAMQAFAAAHALVYDALKYTRGEKWERGADKREKRYFRELLMALSTSLDALADVIAIMFPGSIKGLEAGRSQFFRVEAWVTKPLPTLGILITPSEFYISKLHDALRPIVCSMGPEVDWLPMMRLLRNKSAHLGHPLFRQIGLPGPGHQEMFAFVPRQWPYLWESMVKPANQAPPDPSALTRNLRNTLMHQDILSYSQGLTGKVKSLVAAAASVINETYEQFKNLPENQAALAQLKSNSESYNFENFSDS